MTTFGLPSVKSQTEVSLEAILILSDWYECHNCTGFYVNPDTHQHTLRADKTRRKMQTQNICTGNRHRTGISKTRQKNEYMLFSRTHSSHGWVNATLTLYFFIKKLLLRCTFIWQIQHPHWMQGWKIHPEWDKNIIHHGLCANQFLIIWLHCIPLASSCGLKQSKMLMCTVWCFFFFFFKNLTISCVMSEHESKVWTDL